MPTMQEKSPEEKAQAEAEAAFQQKVREFDGELTALQNKYGLRLSAQVAYPDGAYLTCPIRVVGVQQPPTPVAPAETASKAE